MPPKREGYPGYSGGKDLFVREESESGPRSGLATLRCEENLLSGREFVITIIEMILSIIEGSLSEPGRAS